MLKLEDTILKIVDNLKRTDSVNGVILSKSKKSSGVELDKISDEDLKEYIKKFNLIAYFHNIQQPKYSWHKVNGIIKPVFNAGTIELCKYLPYIPGFDKNLLYKMVGVELGEGTTIAPRVQFDYFNPGLIRIGENSLIGDNAKIWTHEYGIDYFMVGSVNIGNNVKIGTESLIGPCEIGNNVDIGARSFVYGRIPFDSKVIGAKRRRYRK